MWIDVPSAVFEDECRFWTKALASTVARPGTLYPDTHFMVDTLDDVHLGVQRLDDGEARWHFDLASSTPKVGSAHVVSLGADVADGHHEGWVVHTDPAGLVFCTVRDPSYLWLDVPAATLSATLGFWSAALGVTAEPEPGDEDTYFLLGTAGGPVPVGVQRIDIGQPRWHVDLETAHVAAEVARLVELGATPEREIDFWHVLRDPAGLPFCVVPA